MQKQIAGAKIDDRLLKRQEAIIQSMTAKERRNVKLLNASRRRRIAAGSGTTVQDVNRLVKQFEDMGRMIKQMGKLGQKGLMRHGLGALGIGRPR
jgi:signal recognition particle subunit SRP54